MNDACEILFFGMLAEKLNVSKSTINLNDLIDEDDLYISMITLFPDLKNMTFKVAVNGVVTNKLPQLDIFTLALLPPFAGG